MVSIQYCGYGSMLRGDKRSMSPCKHVYCWNTNLRSQMYWSKVKSWLWASVLQLSVNLYNLHLIDSTIWLLWLTLLAWNCVIKTPLLCRMVIFFSNVSLNSYTSHWINTQPISWESACIPLLTLFHLHLSDGAAIHGPEGPRQCAVDCGAGSGGQERSQHQVRDHYFLT